MPLALLASHLSTVATLPDLDPEQSVAPIGPDTASPVPTTARVEVALAWQDLVRVRVGSRGDGEPLAELALPRWVWQLDHVRHLTAAFATALSEAEARAIRSDDGPTSATEVTPLPFRDARTPDGSAL